MPAASSAYVCTVFHEQSARYSVHDESPEGPMGTRKSFTEYRANNKTEGECVPGRYEMKSQTTARESQCREAAKPLSILTSLSGNGLLNRE